MDLFIWGKSNVLFARYLAFNAFDKFKIFTNFKTCDVIIVIMCIRKYTFDYSFRILGNVKMKFGQTVEQLMANISNLFLALLMSLNTSSLSFHNFGKIATCSDLWILSGWCLLFLIILVHLYKLVMMNF